MAAPDDNLSDDIMADITNAGTNVDVDDTSQYFADYEDILNMPVVEDIISYRCMRTYICC